MSTIDDVCIAPGWAGVLAKGLFGTAAQTVVDGMPPVTPFNVMIT